jgi:predicted ATPase
VPDLQAAAEQLRGGRRAAARELLAPVYGWFTEGFDTADLKEAKKTLLDQLA